jgi:hypothetical protein
MINEILILAYIIISAFWNAAVIKDMKSTVHSTAFHSLQAINFLIVIYIAFGFTPLALFYISVRWFAHDLIINILRGNNWLYVGYTSSMDKAIRKVTKRPETILLITKLTLIFLCKYLVETHSI